MKTVLFVLLIFFTTLTVRAQDNYEIQVYASPTVDKGRTMVELHSNYTISGSKIADSYGQLPSNHVVHETIEITHGWTTWFETGFYIFNSIGNNGRTAYVGSHIRPRVAVPDSWKWPVGVSLSTEFGFQKKEFSPNTSTLEIRPIVDKKWNKLYLALNPTVEKSFAGPDANQGFIFSPNVKGSYDVSNVVALGVEYYGSTGRFFHYDPFQQQEHQVYIATDLNFDPNWEFNAGAGYGFTKSTDKAIIKLILGRRF
ncbi:hypothetical protein [Mucilaginibacter segetis]|uniref:Uncharacterized protein n=1 Tax=Mucilaginibacter segetis TaxID=2793071 RepID=A0A934PSQ5_9SPHI|nr:hypothetical protein [Mucilaginibacter segetis]MBK0378917.1 hypothetical protein [Mucilaginibacter segetis]